MEQFRALLIASYGRHYLAERIANDGSHGGPFIQVSTPAKQHVGAVGDRLLLESTSPDQARIRAAECQPRPAHLAYEASEASGELADLLGRCGASAILDCYTEFFFHG